MTLISGITGLLEKTYGKCKAIFPQTKACKYPRLVGLNFSKRGAFQIITISLILIAFLYTCVNAYYLPLFHDEAVTYTHYVSTSFFEILTYKDSTRANNSHLLNTFLIKIFVFFLGNSEFVIRIPALIGHMLYLIGAYKLLKLFLKKYFLILGLCLLIFNPFMLIYFFLARGYSLGLGFLILSLYYLFKKIKQSSLKEKIKNTPLILIMLTLSVLANFAFLYTFFSITFIVILLTIKELISIIKRKKLTAIIFKQIFMKIIFPIILSVLFLLIVCIEPIMKINAEGLFDGGIEGFWEDTVRSLMKQAVLFSEEYPRINIFLVVESLIIFLLIVSLSVIMYKFLKKQRFRLIDKYLLWMTVLLFICSISMIINHTLFNIQYLIGRGAIFFVPMFFIFILILWKNIRLVHNRIIKIIINVLYYLVIIFLLMQYINHIDFYFYLGPELSKIGRGLFAKEVINDIIEINEGKNLEHNSLCIGVDPVFKSNIEYYIQRNKITWMKKNVDTIPLSLDNEFDYYYLFEHETERYNGTEIIKKYNLTIIKEYNNAQGLILAKPAEEPDYR